ncbi:MAG: hypothetical protein LC685_01925, partial [Actinobacteria bacterium]|nr:hypothetical protein [Actinomycetota bacterium]
MAVAAEDKAAEPELRDYLRILRRRKLPIVAVLVVVVAAGLASSFLQTPVYASSAEVLLQPRSNESPFDPQTGQSSDPSRAIGTEIRIVKSQPVKDAVSQQLGSAPPISVDVLGTTDVIGIKAKNTNAKHAADIANAYATAYTDFRRKQAVDDVLAASQQIKTKSDDLQKQIDGLDAQVNNTPLPARDSVRAGLSPQKDALVQQQGLFKQKLDELQVAGALKTGGAQLVTKAVASSVPVSPRPLRTGVIATVVGLLLGMGLAFLLEYLDDSVKTKDDLDRAAPGVPVMGMIPAVASWKSMAEPKVISLEKPQSSAAEAYRTLRTAIQFLSLDQPIRTLQITSPSAQEGKTTTLANLGVALASAGQRVAIVCCDLRRPRVHEFFGLDNATGFTSVLLGKVPLTAALQA